MWRSMLPACMLLLLCTPGCSSADDLPSRADAAPADLTTVDDAPADATTGLDRQACERATAGPFVRDLAAAPNAASAATVKADGQAYELELIGDFAGWVLFEGTAAGRLLLYLDTEAPLSVQDDEGALFENMESSTAVGCDALAIRYGIDLSESGIYLLRIGGSGVPRQKVLLIAEQVE